MIRQLKIVYSFEQDAPVHLAMEKMLMKTVLPGEAVLFFWSNRPCVVIGKHQNPWRECNFEAMTQRGVSVCRRETGGGAVYHDAGNLNISLMADPSDVDGVLEAGLVRGLASCGVQAVLSGRNDLVAPNGRKCCGMAYAESGGILLTHACLLLNTDLDALEACLTPSEKKKASKGVASVRQRVVNLSELIGETAAGGTTKETPTTAAEIEMMRNRFGEAIMNAIAELLNAPDVVVDKTPVPDQTMVAHYASYEWNFGNRTRFELSFSNRFDWGEIEISLTLKQGQIEQCRISSDTLEGDWISYVEEKLVACTMSAEAIERQLMAIRSLPDQIRKDIIKLVKI